MQVFIQEGPARVPPLEYTLSNGQLRVKSGHELLSNLLFWRMGLGGALHDAVDEFLSLDELNDSFVAVEPSPSFLSRLGELEHHGQAGAARAAAFCSAMPKPDRCER